MSYGFYPNIVAALRSESQAEDHRGAGGLCRDAADEIERLRAGLESIVNCRNPLTRAAVREACAEILAGKANTSGDRGGK